MEMSKKTFAYIIVVIITFFAIYMNVFASEIEKTLSFDLYSNMKEKIPFTNSSYNQFKEYFTKKIEQRYDSEKTYLVFLVTNGINNYFYIHNVALEDSEVFKFDTSDFSFFEEKTSGYSTFYSFKFLNENNDIEINSLSATVSMYFNANYVFQSLKWTGISGLVWSNKPIKYSKDIDMSKNYYRYKFQSVSDDLKKYYDFSSFGYQDPIYTYCNLMFGDYEVKEPTTVAYKVEYYFDDILDSSKTEFRTALSGTEIKEYMSYETDLYKLVENNYSIVLSEDETQNVLKIYYRSPFWGTEKQSIDTSSSKVYLFFQYNDIKAMFPNVTFENFTQYQQLIVTVLFNILYCVFLILCVIILLRACMKVWNWILSFVI